MRPMLALLSLLALFSGVAHCQEPKTFTRTFSSDDAALLREANALVVPKEGGLVVDMILGNSDAAASELKKGDKILMANGKKVRTVKELQELYKTTTVGMEMKLGAERDGNLFIVKFTRKSDEELNAAGGGRVMRFEAKEGERILPALGLRVMTEKKQAVVSGTLPNAGRNFTSYTPAEKDVIVSLNGKSVSSAEGFDESYTSLKEGTDVTIVFERNGKSTTVTFPKPKAAGQMIIRR